MFFFHMINVLLTTQGCSVKMAEYWRRSFLRVYGLGPYTRKERLGQYPAILTSRLVNNQYKLPKFEPT